MNPTLKSIVRVADDCFEVTFTNKAGVETVCYLADPFHPETLGILKFAIESDVPSPSIICHISTIGVEWKEKMGLKKEDIVYSASVNRHDGCLKLMVVRSGPSDRQRQHDNPMPPLS